MAILQGILQDSLKHYQDQKSRINLRLQQLPKGSVLKRRISGRDYYYLKLRKGGRVVSAYVGKIRPKKLEDAIRERRLLQKQMKEVLENLRILARTQKKRRRRG